MSNMNFGPGSNGSAIKDEFYEALFRDYFEYREDGVLYKYFLNDNVNREKENKGKRSDKEKRKIIPVEEKIRSFFNNAGYEFKPSKYNKENTEDPHGVEFHPIRKRTRKNNNHDDAEGGRKPRKDQTLTILEQYCEKIGKTSLFEINAESGMPEEASVEKLFVFLNQNGKTRKLDLVRVPLVIDRDTGCSLEIVGRGFYPKAREKDCCAYRIYRFNESGAYTRARDEENRRPFRFHDYAEAMVQFRIECKDEMGTLQDNNTNGEQILKLPKELRKAFPRHFPDDQLNENKKFLERSIGKEERASATAYIEAPTKKEHKRKHALERR